MLCTQKTNKDLELLLVRVVVLLWKNSSKDYIWSVKSTNENKNNSELVCCCFVSKINNICLLSEHFYCLQIQRTKGLNIFFVQTSIKTVKIFIKVFKMTFDFHSEFRKI